MKAILTTEAVGQIISHDITIIVKDQVKGVAFKKGHIVQEEDIPTLLSLGKDHLYVLETNDSLLHEDDAAKILADLCQNQYMEQTAVSEGKIELVATCSGLFTVDQERLPLLNEQEDLMIATRHSNDPVNAGDKLAGTRIIPLAIDKAKMTAIQTLIGKEPLLRIHPYVRKTAAIVTTGNEVFYKRIVDTFTPVIVNKLSYFDVEVVAHAIVPDDLAQITAAITSFKEQGVDLVLCTGGMSVDPDDLTPTAIRDSQADIISYGAPVLPGAMFLLGYWEDGTPVMGLPGCVMYAKATIFDILLPRILADYPITKKAIAQLGIGGLCLNCPTCTFPNCGFGKSC